MQPEKTDQPGAHRARQAYSYSCGPRRLSLTLVNLDALPALDRSHPAL